eukprot:3479580-Amphidinium_carterae.1
MLQSWTARAILTLARRINLPGACLVYGLQMCLRKPFCMVITTSLENLCVERSAVACNVVTCARGGNVKGLETLSMPWVGQTPLLFWVLRFVFCLEGHVVACVHEAMQGLTNAVWAWATACYTQRAWFDGVASELRNRRDAEFD